MSALFGVGFGQCITTDANQSVGSVDGRQEIRLREDLQRIVGKLYCFEEELPSLLLSAGAYVKISNDPKKDRPLSSPQPLQSPGQTRTPAQERAQQPPQDQWSNPVDLLSSFVKTRFSPTTVADELKRLDGGEERQHLLYLCFSYTDPTNSLPEEVAILLDEEGVRV
jgi:hypothetical protein